MGDKPEDKNKKGFAGFESFSDDLTVEIPETADSAAPKKAKSAEEKPKPKSQKSPQSGSYLKRKIRAFKYKAAENKSWWVIGGAVVVFVLVSMNTKPHQRTTSSYTPSTTSSYNTATETESKPAVGTNNVLGYAELRYCFAEKVRMDAIQPAVNLYAQEEVDKFNALVSDYNIRCGQFQYRKNNYTSAERYVENNRAAIAQEGLNRLKSWRGVTPPITTPSAELPAGFTLDKPQGTPDSNLEKKFWYKPTKLEGVYHKKTFMNCCFQGLERKDNYNDLQLSNPVDVIPAAGDTTAKQLAVTNIQISYSKNMMNGVKDGDKISVKCKTLWEGNTGHYALPVYCDAESVEKYKADPQAELDSNIAKKTGLLLARIDAKGNPIPLTGGYEPDSKFLLMLNGKKVLEDGGSVYMHFAYHKKIKNEDVVLLATSSGGNMCPVEHKLISISNGAVTKIIDDLGSCSSPEITTPTDEEIKFTFWRDYGARLVVVYKDHQLTKTELKLPLHQDADEQGTGFRYLLKYTKENDLENVLLDAKLQPQLKAIMGDDFNTLKDNLGVFTPPFIDNEFLVIQGALPHSFTIAEGYLAVGLDSSEIFSAVLISETNPITKKFVSYVKAYKPTYNSTLPASMTTWLKEKPSDIRWNTVQ